MKQHNNMTLDWLESKTWAKGIFSFKLFFLEYFDTAMKNCFQKYSKI